MLIDDKQAAEELHTLIRECDLETLAAIYENAFGAVENVAVRDGMLEVTYVDGLGPEDI
jgi:hypothetical protein